jgi:replicative DNA helicase
MKSANNDVKEMIAKSTPRNLEAEAAVLGCILIDDIVAGDVVPDLTPQHFFSENNRIIFNAMLALQAQGITIDVVSVSDKLEKTGELQKIGSMSYLSGLTADIPSAANIDHYVSMVKRDCLLRKLIRTGTEIAELGYKSEDAERALDIAQQLIYSISRDNSKGDLVHISESATKFIKSLEDVQKGIRDPRGILSGFKNLDDFICGFKPGTYSLIAARPSVGKTAFALSIAINAAIVQKKYVALFNMEMTAVEIAARVLTNMSSVSSSVQKMTSGMRPSQRKEIINSYVDLVNSQFYVDDSADNSPAKIMSKCRKLALSKGGLDLVIIDYLGLMTMGG